MSCFGLAMSILLTWQQGRALFGYVCVACASPLSLPTHFSRGTDWLVTAQPFTFYPPTLHFGLQGFGTGSVVSNVQAC